MRPAVIAPASAIMAATALLALGTHAQTPPVFEGSPEGISSIRAESSLGRSAAWSEESMRSAQPAPLPTADPDAVRAAFRSRGFSGHVLGGQTEDGPAPAGLGRQSGDVHSFPLSMVGRLFFNEDGDAPGVAHSCTAQFVDQNVILTASHCVQDDKPPFAYHKNFAFALQYDRRTMRHVYHWGCLGNPKGWAQESAARYLYDYAMIQTDTPSDVGWFGLQWNWVGMYNRATKVGYSSGSLAGEVVQVDAGPLTVSDGLVELKHGNKNVQHGSSGGGYVGDYSTVFHGKENHIISSESFSRGKDGETSGIGYGPYYTDGLQSLLNYVKNGCKS